MEIRHLKRIGVDQVLLLTQARATGSWHSHQFQFEPGDGAQRGIVSIAIDPLEASAALGLMAG
jgi:hypothetical protein